MTENETETEEYQVVIPEESFTLLEFQQEKSIGSAVINAAPVSYTHLTLPTINSV